MKESVLDLVIYDGPLLLLNESDGPMSYILKALSISKFFTDIADDEVIINCTFNYSTQPLLLATGQ